MEPKRERGRDGALWEVRAHQFELLGDGPVSKCGVCGLLTMPSHPHKQQECWVEVEFAPESDKALLLASQAEVACLTARVQELERELSWFTTAPEWLSGNMMAIPATVYNRLKALADHARRASEE